MEAIMDSGGLSIRPTARMVRPPDMGGVGRDIEFELQDKCNIPRRFANTRLTNLPSGAAMTKFIKQVVAEQDYNRAIAIVGKGDVREYCYSVLRTFKLLSPRSICVALSYGDIIESYKAMDGLSRDSSLSMCNDTFLIRAQRADVVYFTDWHIGLGINFLEKREKDVLDRYFTQLISNGVTVIVGVNGGTDKLTNGDWGYDLSHLVGSADVVLSI